MKDEPRERDEEGRVRGNGIKDEPGRRIKRGMKIEVKRESRKGKGVAELTHFKIL